jgi:nucleotide-binding universal stress UspA family protein
MFKKLLVAYDGSEGATRALHAGIGLAQAFGVDLHLVTVEEELPRYAATLDEVEAVREQKEAYFGRLHNEATAVAEKEGVRLHCAIVAGHEVEAIRDHILLHGFDLLLVGFHGHSAIMERLRGSTTGSLVLCAPCTVMVVK